MTSENTMAQIELEYKILSSFLLCDDGSRDRIAQLDSGMFSDVNTKGIFDIFKGEYSKHPKADYMAYVLLLNADQRKNIISSLESSISPDIAQSRLDDTLSAFRSAYVQRVLSTAAAEISLKSDIGISDIHSLIQPAARLLRIPPGRLLPQLHKDCHSSDVSPSGAGIMTLYRQAFHSLTVFLTEDLSKELLQLSEHVRQQEKPHLH